MAVKKTKAKKTMRGKPASRSAAKSALPEMQSDELRRAQSERIINACRSAVSDISERTRAEKILHEHERNASALINAADESILMFGLNGDILAANGTAAWRLGMSADEIVGKKWADILPPELMAQRKKKIEQVVLTGGPVRFEDERAGRIFDHSAYPVRDDTGQITAIAIFGRDITERRKAEEAVKQANVELALVNRELEAFSYAVSNGLKAPLRVIEGFSRAIIEDNEASLADSAKDYFQRITSASQRMSQLIDALLNMARLTRGELREKSVDLSGLAEVIVHELRNSRPERQVQIVIAPDLKVQGDKDMLRTVLENLLDNAWKFASQQPSAKIEFGADNREGTTIYFVRDNGVGFDMQFAENLFQPFKRLHGESEFPGLGIGLAIAHRIIMRHGGRIWAESEVGKGTTFYFTL